MATSRVIVTVIFCLFLSPSIAKNESNILRLSKPQKSPADQPKASNFNVSDDFGDEAKAQSPGPLITFSKNNPELDWKNHIKNAAKIENDSLRDLDVDFMKNKIEMTANSVQWLVDLYDPLRWKRVPGKLDQECRRDMDWFLKALRDGKLWAAKMSDASGRYGSQFHFGNGFWLGSSTLCLELNGTEKTGVGGIGGIGVVGVNGDDVPPYSVKFHVARMFLTLPSDIELLTRQIFLGLCLPDTCDRISLTSMLRASADRVEREGNSTHSRSSGPKIHIVTVKPVPSSDYSAWLDPKFYVLGSVGGAIVFLMLCAAICEYRSHGDEKDVESTSNGASNNNERISTYADKNIPEERRISMIQDNGKELIDKMDKCVPDNGKEDSTIKFKRRERGFLYKCFMCFNPISNGNKILSTEVAAKDSLTCLHGLRVLSLGWVVMVHTYLEVFSIAENKTLRTVTERNFMFQTISNATFSVDTFFFISGLLVTILFYRSLGALQTDKSNFFKSSSTKFLIMILYRFVRLTPAYLFVLGMNEIAIKQAHARTVFSPAIIDHLTCEKFWWRNALYLNSLYPRTEMCMLWSWYMANDTQFYVLGILLLLLSVKYFKAVVAAVALIIVSSWFTTFTVAYSNDYIARIQEPFALFDELYDKPWLRVGPYFIGTITGWLLFKTNCKLYTPTWLKLIGWLVSAAIMSSVVYGLYPGNLTVTTSSAYASLGHTAWAIAVSFLVIQCCTGSAAIINGLLSLRLMYPLSRLTYCAYLVHPVIMMMTSTQMDGPLHLHNGLVLIVYFGNLVASYLMSFCISVALEAPVVNLLKLAFTTNQRGK
ncbi:nose resistant to fluoxetine protein 6-like [Venturia canescens]|uniref:nose resistant to fluoxetine protein 6-like n=1 Tax=Venturia canescens TaxID=32260 RepID=UPI001C9CC260|nr:nose resistant to fluoxetine protein 6-like [Venturia canescens]